MKYLLTILTAVFLHTWTAQAQTPVQFNEHMVSIINTLSRKGSAWSAKFNEAYKSKNFQQLKPLRLDMQQYVDARLNELKSLPEIKGAAEFREAMIRFLNFEKNLIISGFMPAEKLTASSTEEEVQKIIRNFTAISKKEKAELEKVKAAQLLFSRNNGYNMKSQ